MTQTIHPANIESELSRIWDSFQGSNKMRACLFNLLIYAKKCQRIGYLNQVVQKVIEKFPSRVIFITHDDSCSDQEIRTAVSVMSADKGECEIACDLIEIEVCRKDHPKVPFVVLPHILPDLPIYLVHADDPSFKNPIAEKLEHLAHRIIFDSEAACDLPAFAQAALSHNTRCDADIADLNWARTEGWRQLFANVFKSSEELERLKHASKISICFNSKKTRGIFHTNIQSIYLQSWVAVQLGWTLKTICSKKERLTFHYQSEFGDVESVIIPSRCEKIPPGRIFSVEIETDRKCHYSFKRNLGCLHHVTIEKSSPELCSLPVDYVLDKSISGQSLVKEICHKGTSAHYIKMLQLLSSIKNESLCNG